MALTPTKFIWMNGELKPWADATTHVMTHALHYGSAVFEGIRCYDTPSGPQIFRLDDHITRLFHSGRVYQIDIPYEVQEVIEASQEIIRVNDLKSAYIRPLAYKGYGSIGVVGEGSPIDIAIAAFPWGAYLGEDSLKDGIDVCISSWQRLAPNTVPTGVKAAGNYLSSQLISLEAKSRGFAEGIGLGTDGLVSEGAGENLFVVYKDTLYTPPSSASILSGITRDSVISLAKDMGIAVVEQTLPREMLYIADEMFFSGTAVEITPIRSIDRLSIGTGSRPITSRIQDAFFGLFNGKTEDKWGWLQPVGADSKG